MKHIQLESTLNTRDLGGYHTENGQRTAHQKFYRSDHFKTWTKKDYVALINLGVQKVIDLRSMEETIQTPSVFKDNESIYCNIPFSIPQLDDIAMYQNMNLGDFYVMLLKQRQVVKQIFEEMVFTDGVVLFHCTAGKDRTGVISLLLLMLARTRLDDLVKDYEVTYDLIKPLLIQQKVANQYNEQMMYSLPESILKAHDYIETSGGVWTYLRSCDLTDEMLHTLQGRLLSG